MSKAMRLFWLITLVFFAGGCSSYKFAPYPCIEDEAEMTVGLESRVDVGDKVRITMADSSKVKGKVMGVSMEAITLEPKTRSIYEKKMYGESQPRVINAASIQTLEVQVPSSGKTVVLVGAVIVGFLSLLGIAVATADNFP